MKSGLLPGKKGQASRRWCAVRLQTESVGVPPGHHSLRASLKTRVYTWTPQPSPFSFESTSYLRYERPTCNNCPAPLERDRIPSCSFHGGHRSSALPPALGKSAGMAADEAVLAMCAYISRHLGLCHMGLPIPHTSRVRPDSCAVLPSAPQYL